MTVAFRALGPLEIVDGDRTVRIAADKQRTILAMLIAHRGSVVSVPALLEELWGGTPPRSAVPNLRTYVMQLRRLLPPADGGTHPRLITSRSGYMLRADDDETDIARFEDLVERARQAAAGQDLARAARSLSSALALWHGEPLENVAKGPVLEGIAAALTEQYLGAIEAQADVALARGAGAAMVDTLRRAVRRHPLRERLRTRLMLALYHSGDTAGALAAFTDARETLRNELGLDPGPELCRTHQAVLRREPDLSAVPEAPTRTTAPPAHPLTGTVPRQLPRIPGPFAGRAQDTARVRDVLRTRDGTAAGAPVVVLHGPAGRGKSALALHVAHAAAADFPDGQLYVDLDSPQAGADPVDPVTVLRHFLRSFGMPRADVPAALSEASAYYQSMVAGRRVLVVVDNAFHRGQVLPLLPAAPGCAVLVTSRSVLPALDAVHVPVHPLDETDSVRLLSLLVGDARVTAEPRAAREIARLCHGNPLALSIAGARCAGRPQGTLAGLAARLRDPARTLDELRVADLAMRSSYARSYRQLSAHDPEHRAAARAFRRLCTLGSPFSATRAAEAIGAALPATERALDCLVTVGLLTPVAHEGFRMPDLAGLYARELAARDRARCGELVLSRPAN
ncbi:AfsR/SARP family transcriptional regulator [Streptomyces sp. NRRL S-118]|uniref:AfsR/SARP family transcriptional regulator n=1 Tax=Streptomyces sp. NRRL S-118 TaxID=1463881 RepID=UPI000693C88E|nr:AfsR/SARP family transcriptional regulator [Streptomyces sp. NRRL S-118]